MVGVRGVVLAAGKLVGLEVAAGGLLEGQAAVLVWVGRHGLHVCAAELCLNRIICEKSTENRQQGCMGVQQCWCCCYC